MIKLIDKQKGNTALLIEHSDKRRNIMICEWYSKAFIYTTWEMIVLLFMQTLLRRRQDSVCTLVQWSRSTVHCPARRPSTLT